MPQVAAGRGFRGSLARRWWVIPPALLLVIGALVLKALTEPIAASATIGNGAPDVVRSSAIVLTFNQDMNVASVRDGFRIKPIVPYTVTVRNPRTFEFRPTLAADAFYAVQVVGAKKAIGFGQMTYTIAFHTEPAPRVTAATWNSAALADGQQAVPLRGELAISFSQPMDSTHTPILLDNNLLDSKTIRWDTTGTTATMSMTVKHSRPHSLAVPQTAANRRHDQMAADWKLGFTSMVQVPSAGSTDRIGSSGAPILIQIENSDQPWVRPQDGMQQADMIYEYISEFGIPRLTAVYWHPPKTLIGPVRSCRLITIQLEMMYKGMIYCSGANDYVLGQVWKFPNVVYDYSYWLPYMFRTLERAAPHNVMARPGPITAHTAQSNLAPLTYDVALAHDDAVAPGAVAAPTVFIAAHNATWRYDPKTREYFKWQEGAPFRNVGTGQVHAKTVIVMHVASHIDLTPGNKFHHYYTEYYELAGQGAAEIYTDGMLIHATWQHPDRNVPVVYADANGDPIDFNTGLSWVHVVGSDQ